MVSTLQPTYRKNKKQICQDLYFMHNFWPMHQASCWIVRSLVGGNNLVNPTAQVGDTSIHGGGTHVAVGGAPGDDTDKRPHPAVLTDQRAPGVTLKCQNMQCVTPQLCPKVIHIFLWQKFQTITFCQAGRWLLPGRKTHQKHLHKSWHH